MFSKQEKEQIVLAVKQDNVDALLPFLERAEAVGLNWLSYLFECELPSPELDFSEEPAEPSLQQETLFTIALLHEAEDIFCLLFDKLPEDAAWQEERIQPADLPWLHYAALTDLKRVFELLLQRGNTNQLDTPLMLELIGENASNDPACYKDYGKRPLHFAVKSLQVEVVSILLSKGANVHLADYDGQTALDVLFDSWLEAETELCEDALVILQFLGSAGAAIGQKFNAASTQLIAESLSREPDCLDNCSFYGAQFNEVEVNRCSSDVLDKLADLSNPPVSAELTEPGYAPRFFFRSCLAVLIHADLQVPEDQVLVGQILQSTGHISDNNIVHLFCGVIAAQQWSVANNHFINYFWPETGDEPGIEQRLSDANVKKIVDSFFDGYQGMQHWLDIMDIQAREALNGPAGECLQTPGFMAVDLMETLWDFDARFKDAFAIRFQELSIVKQGGAVGMVLSPVLSALIRVGYLDQFQLHYYEIYLSGSQHADHPERIEKNIFAEDLVGKTGSMPDVLAFKLLDYLNEQKYAEEAGYTLPQLTPAQQELITQLNLRRTLAGMFAEANATPAHFVLDCLVDVIKRGSSDIFMFVFDKYPPIWVVNQDLSSSQSFREEGGTFLHYAAEYHKSDVARLLMDKGAGIQALNVGMLTPLDKFFERYDEALHDFISLSEDAQTDAVATLQCLLQAGAAVGVEFDAFQTAFIHEIALAVPGVFNVCCFYGASWDFCENQGLPEANRLAITTIEDIERSVSHFSETLLASLLFYAAGQGDQGDLETILMREIIDRDCTVAMLLRAVAAHHDKTIMFLCGIFSDDFYGLGDADIEKLTQACFSQNADIENFFNKLMRDSASQQVIFSGLSCLCASCPKFSAALAQCVNDSQVDLEDYPVSVSQGYERMLAGSYAPAVEASPVLQPALSSVGGQVALYSLPSPGAREDCEAEFLPDTPSSSLSSSNATSPSSSLPSSNATSPS